MKQQFQFANRSNPEETMQVQGVTYIFQGNVDPEYVEIMNPNDGRKIKKASVDAAPTLLGTFKSNVGWSYYKNAIMPYHHPFSADPDFVGLYVLAEDQERIFSSDFSVRRKQEIEEMTMRGIPRYIKPEIRAQAASGTNVVSLFPK